MTESELPDIPAGADSVVFVDFDHTLFSANSTEMFIAYCQPSFAVSLIELLVRRAFPWRLTGLQRWFRLRDYVCVLVICVAMPWNVLIWRRRAPVLFDRYLAKDVADRLAGIPAGRLFILSFGLEFIIKSLVARSRFAEVRLSATPFLSGIERFRHGKKQLAIDLVGAQAAGAATLITDSDDDADLLAYSATGIKIPQQGESWDARTRLYLPLRYFAMAKYGRSFAVDQLLLVDALVYALAISQGFGDLWRSLIVCPIFVLSLNCIYEIGYFENDMHAAKREAEPVLRDNVSRFSSYPIHVQSWLWAAATGAAGIAATIYLFDIPLERAPAMAWGWLAALLLVRALFFIYNRLETRRRIFLYPALQVVKYGAVLAIFSAGVFGILLIISQIATMWVTYIVYRLGGDQKQFQRETFRSVLFAIGALLFLLGAGAWRGTAAPVGPGISPGDWFCLAAILVWSAFRMSKAAFMRRWKARRAPTREHRP